MILNQYTAWLKKYHRVILWITAILAIVGAVYSAKLYKNLRTDIEELLPESALSVKDLKSVSNRVGGLNHLSVVIETQNRDAGLRFMKDVSAKLRELPKEQISRVEDNIQRERQFF